MAAAMENDAGNIATRVEAALPKQPLHLPQDLSLETAVGRAVQTLPAGPCGEG